MPTQIEASLESGVLRLVFVTEGALNTIDDHWLDALYRHLREASDDKAVRAVLLSAQGRVFCAGANLQGLSTGALSQPFAGSPLHRLSEELSVFPKPLIAAVHGKAIGGGATLLLHCDLVAA